MKNSGSEDV